MTMMLQAGFILVLCSSFYLLTSFLLVFLQRGANEISSVYGLDKSFSDILTGIILFFIIGCEFFINYQLKFRSAHKEEN